MSTYWYLHCRTCNTTEKVGWWNHGAERGLREIRDALPKLAALAEMQLTCVEITIQGPEYNNGILKFAAAHHTHDVVLKNEYGGIDETCGAWFRCSSCDHSLSCTLAVGHEGEHGRA